MFLETFSGIAVLAALVVCFFAYSFYHTPPQNGKKSILSPPSIATTIINQVQGQFRGSIETRKNIITEILTTERTYVECLKNLFEMYIKPLNETVELERKRFLSGDKVKKIFPSSLEVIRRMNENLLAKMESRLASGVDEGTVIADLFIDIAPFLKCYTSYVNSFNASNEELMDASKGPKLKEFLDRVGKTPGLPDSAKHLPSLLIQPVQRIPRYCLLLNELLKHTPPSHKDHENIKKALVAMKGITSLLDNNKDLSDNLEKVMAIENNLKLSHSLSRKLIKQGEFKCKIGSKQEKTLECYIFNDCFVGAQKKKSRLTGKISWTVVINVHLASLESIDADEESKQMMVQSPGRTLIFVPVNDASVKEWSLTLKDATSAALNSVLSFNTLRIPKTVG